jgi:hypothetical protein
MVGSVAHANTALEIIAPAELRDASWLIAALMGLLASSRADALDERLAERLWTYCATSKQMRHMSRF